MSDLLKSEGRFRDATEEQMAAAQDDVDVRWKMFSHLATMK